VRFVNSYRVSVVIPNYWDGDTVRETLESVGGGESVEVIVVDDASPAPDTSAKLEQYRRDGLIDTLVLREKNGGVSVAMNDGIAVATADYVWLMGNDDLLVAGTLERFADVLDGNTRLGFAVGGYRCFGARRSRFVPAPWDPWSVRYRNRWPGCLMIRRDVLEQVGGLDPDLVFSDWDLYWRFAEHGIDGFVTPDVAYLYRVHSDNRLWASTRRHWRKEYALLRSKHAELFADGQRLRQTSNASVLTRMWLYSTAYILRNSPPRVTELIFTVVQGFDRLRRNRARSSSD
jgi:GT2 family glycosyltransferase